MLEPVYPAGSLEGAHSPPHQCFLVIAWELPLSQTWGSALLHLGIVMSPLWTWLEAHERRGCREHKVTERVAKKELWLIHLFSPPCIVLLGGKMKMSKTKYFGTSRSSQPSETDRLVKQQSHTRG